MACSGGVWGGTQQKSQVIFSSCQALSFVSILFTLKPVAPSKEKLVLLSKGAVAEKPLLQHRLIFQRRVWECQEEGEAGRNRFGAGAGRGGGI